MFSYALFVCLGPALAFLGWFSGRGDAAALGLLGLFMAAVSLFPPPRDTR